MKIKTFGKNIRKRTRHIGNKSTNQISYNGNTGLKKEKLEMFREKKEELLLNKRKNKEKKRSSFKNILKKSNYAII